MTVPGKAELAMVDAARLGLTELEPGWVWLVGAGPGDPGLLSALALQALGEAEVVVYDALVDARIQRLARPAGRLDPDPLGRPASRQAG